MWTKCPCSHYSHYRTPQMAYSCLLQVVGYPWHRDTHGTYLTFHCRSGSLRLVETHQGETDTNKAKEKPKRSSADSCWIAIFGVCTSSRYIYDHSEVLFSNVQHKVNRAMISCTDYTTRVGIAKEDFVQPFCKASSTSENVLPGSATILPLALSR